MNNPGYLLIGAPDPKPEPPAAVAPVVCFRCRGRDAVCPTCLGASPVPLDRHAAVLVRAAA